MATPVRPPGAALPLTALVLALVWMLPPNAAAEDRAPALEPSKLSLGRVYRGTKRSFSLRARASGKLRVTAEPAVAASGLRAVGVSVRAPEEPVPIEEGGEARIELVFVARAAASLGPGTVRVVVEDEAGRSAGAVISFDVARSMLVAPARVDLGEAFVRGAARATVELALESPTGVSAWLEWTGLSGEAGEILPAFVRPDRRAFELGPGETVKVPIAVELPRGTRPGRYSGKLRVGAGPHAAEIELVLVAVMPRLSAEPGTVDLGKAGAGGVVSGEFKVKLLGAASEELRTELAGPLRKSGRPQAVLEGLRVTPQGARQAEGQAPRKVRPALTGVEIPPGEEAAARIEGAIPDGQEDGEYRGEVALRAGSARLMVPVRIVVPRRDRLPPFEVDPLEFTVAVPAGGETTAAVRVKSHEDVPLEIRARIDWAEDAWDVALEEESSPGQRLISLPPRGEAELGFTARPPPRSRVGRKVEVRLALEGAGAEARSDVVLEVVRGARPAEVPAKVATAGRIVLIVLAIVFALAAAAGWRIVPVRYGAMSAAVHALVLVVGVDSPITAAPARSQPGGRALAIRVIQVEDPFGEDPFAGAPAAPGEAGDGSHTGEEPGPDPGGAAAGPDGSLAPPLPPLAPVAIPSHPEAPPSPEEREAHRIALAPAPAPGRAAGEPSGGFDIDGPQAELSLLAPGEIRRARASGTETFGAMARELRSGLIARREATLVENVPHAAPAVAPEPLRRPAPLAGRSRGAALAARPGRERTSLDGPAERSFREARAKLALSAARELPPTAARATSGLSRAEVRERVAVPAAGTEQRRPETVPRPRRSPGPSRAIARVRAPRPVTAMRPPPSGPPPPAPPPRRLALATAAGPSPVVPVRVPDRRALPEEKAQPVAAAGSPRPPRTPERGRQTVTRARGRSPAGRPGRVEESFARADVGRPAVAVRAAKLSRAGLGSSRGVLMSPSRGAPRTGRARAARSRVVLGMLRHAGEWAASPRAMTALAHELPARQPGWSFEVRAMPVRTTENALFDCALVYLTGRRDPGMDRLALARLRKYLERGGFLWIDDGAPPGDETFGRASRRLLAKLMPGASLRRVRLTHPLFSSAYELARGYLGRSVPAGAWARQSEVQGLFDPNGRLVAVHTRNGYGRAMELDPAKEPSFRPPVGLTPREAREGALRMATNIAVHVLRSGGEPLSGDPAREEFDPARRYRYRGRAIEVVRGAFDPAAWRAVRQGAPLGVSGANGTLVLDVSPSERDMAGAARKGIPGIERARAVVFDVRLGRSSPARVALRFRSSGGDVYESTPLYVRAGLNADLRVPLDAADFRATATGFRSYDAPLDTTKAMSSLAVILYGKDLGGRVEFSRLRLDGWGAR